MTYEEFKNMNDNEQQIFFAKLIHMVKNNESSFQYAAWIIEAGEEQQYFKNIKFGSEAVYKETEPELIGIPLPS